MLTKKIFFKNFSFKKSNKKILVLFQKLIKEDNEILISMGNFYKDSYLKKKVLKLKKFKKFNLVGMGGSVLGARSIYSFLNHKIKKTFLFKNDLIDYKQDLKFNKRDTLNIIVSKSGNTLETIINTNILINKKQNNIFITENKKSYLMNLADKLKSEIIHHNNYIGGRYSVLSEVGMVPAQLMGLNTNKFRRFNYLVKNKKFINALVSNVSKILHLANSKKSNSIILNYDEKSLEFFQWYQQLVAESLGKKGKGVLPIISQMPKDNHSLMQFYLDGFKKNFYTFYFVEETNSRKIVNSTILKSHSYLKNKSINEIKRSQFNASRKVFEQKNIPHRSFVIKKRDEESLGELFTFFILETILLGKAMNINPYDQPAVELIKKETSQILKRT